MESDKHLHMQLEQFFDEHIRPVLRSHGGEVSIESITANMLCIKLLGRCHNCPSATLSTKQFIQKEVCSAFTQIGKVEVVQNTNTEMLEMARHILNYG